MRKETYIDEKGRITSQEHAAYLMITWVDELSGTAISGKVLKLTKK